MSQSIIFRFASIAMALAVAFGAFGAHALKERLSAGDLEIWKTGVLYQLIHALALLAIAASWHMLEGPRSDWAVRLIMAGMTVFSFSLYLLVLTGPRWLGAITPIGGVMMIVGWLLFATATFNSLRTY